MSDRNPRPSVLDPMSAADAEGHDSYPTYQDGPGSHRASKSQKPTDVKLAQSKRTYGLPMLIGLLVSAVVIIAGIVFGGINLASISDSALTPGTPAATNTSTAGATSGAPLQGENLKAQPGVGSGPGTVGASPGEIDVPGGATTSPAPSQP